MCASSLAEQQLAQRRVAGMPKHLDLVVVVAG
jgi:hypothetical protein